MTKHQMSCFWLICTCCWYYVLFDFAGRLWWWNCS